LNAASWSLDAMGLAVFTMIEPFLGDVVMLGLDDTLARKRGLRMFGTGMHHDPLSSTRSLAFVRWGHNWVVLGVIVDFPFRPGHWIFLPLLFRLYVNRQTVAKHGGHYRTRPNWAPRCFASCALPTKTGVFTLWPTAPTAGRTCSRSCRAIAT
jgi:hypothetical protein